ncbi:kinase-like domain-containing protein [Pisolithus marmoratus]|nr:kinase-like domain-containing protein [Pisolithus marmoratus]
MAGMNQGPPPGFTVPCNNDGTDSYTPDIQHYLQEFSERASRYTKNLDQWVDRDPTACFAGGDAIVYRGTLRPEGTCVAVKTFRFGHRSSPTVLKTMLREVHVWSKLMHPNVLPLLGIATKFDDTISIISRWITKGNAHDYVQDLRVDPRPVLLGIARGLDYLHNRTPNPVYHGDLKGSNILISDEGHALLTDFGLSYLVNSSFSMTVHDRCGGTLNWMAPELLDVEGNVVKTSAGDVWSFGMTVLELFTRHVPFHDTYYQKHVMVRILQDRLPGRPSDNSTGSRMTDGWWGLCRSCWNPEVSLRPSMSQIVEAIEQCIPDPRSISVCGVIGSQSPTRHSGLR